MPRLSGSSWNSLERKLPVLIGGLVIAFVLATFVIVRLELRESAVESAGERLARVAHELVQLANTSTAQRHALMLDVAAEPILLAAARREAVDSTTLRHVIGRLQVPTDQGEPIVLVAADGEVLVREGGRAAGDSPRSIALRDGITYSPLQRAGERTAFWVAVPVRDGNGIVHAHLVQRRTIGSAGTGQQIQALFGGQIMIALASSDGRTRALIDGTFVDDALEVPALNEPFERIGADGRRYHSFAAPLANGMTLLTELPRGAVVARATQVTRRLLAVGALLLLLGGLAAWVVSRSVTKPLRRLADAADAIACGDYSRRTGLARDDEIGQLARSFDAMAGFVDASHAQLEQRFQEARHLAGELEAANTRLQEAVTELELARREAQQANAVKAEFLATMSHEIRTPINAMVGYTDLMELGVPGPLTEQQREYVERIRRSGEHLIAVVNDVLDFAKVESGQMRVGRDILPAAAVLEEAVSLMQARASSRGVRLELVCPPDAPLLGDRQRLHQILLNLLSNAIKFTPADGSVTVTCERRIAHDVTSQLPHDVVGDSGDARAAAWTCIVVEDTGIGIPPEQRDLIFEPFVQGSAGYTRPHGGTGLGLAISRSLARLMGGDLTVESEPGRGARFTVWLPAFRGAEQLA